MPELPEVATAVQVIAPQIVGRPIISTQVSSHLEGEWWDKSYLESGLVIYSVSKRGKYIELHLVDVREVQQYLSLAPKDRINYRYPGKSRGVLVIHLGMSGMVTMIDPISTAPQPHRHMLLHLGAPFFNPPYLDEASSVLRANSNLQFYDPRKFGRVAVCKTPSQLRRLYKHTGPDPMMLAAEDRAGNGTYSMNLEKGARLFIHRLRSAYTNTKPLKECLMSQTAVSGFGNIYASEALFLSGLHPLRTLEDTADRWLRLLYDESVNMFMRATMCGGSSVNSYKNPNGISGTYQEQHFVYGRAGLPCKVCQTTIETDKHNGRSTFWCPRCQK